MDDIQLKNVKVYHTRPIWFISTQKKMYYKFMYSLLLWLLNQTVVIPVLIQVKYDLLQFYKCVHYIYVVFL